MRRKDEGEWNVLMNNPSFILHPSSSQKCEAT